MLRGKVLFLRNRITDAEELVLHFLQVGAGEVEGVYCIQLNAEVVIPPHELSTCLCLWLFRHII